MKLFTETEKEDSTEYTIPMGKVNLLAFLFILPILGLFLFPYIFLWDFTSVKEGYRLLLKNIIVIIIGGVILHELLHGLTWAIFTKQGFKQIKFGMNWKYLTPYTHFKKPIKVKFYLLGALMPLLIMGILPTIYGIISGNGFYLLFGIFFTWAAAGDMIASIRLFRLPMNLLVQDHPDTLGFIIYNKAT